MKRLRTVLLMTLATIAVLELLCRVFDPLGVVYFDDVAYLWNTRIDDPTGYAHVPGRFAIGGRFAITIDADGNRVTPDSAAGGPQMTFIGDSQTFGYGVNDADTWVNLTTGALEIDATNVARSGYNIENIAAQLDAITGCVVWLTISNDPNPPVRYSGRQAYGPTSYLGASLGIALAPPSAFAGLPVGAAVRPLYAAIAARPDTLILVMDDGSYSETLRDDFGATVIPHFTERISPTDAHADAEGNRQIAEAARPIIQNWLDEHDCT